MISLIRFVKNKLIIVFFLVRFAWKTKQKHDFYKIPVNIFINNGINSGKSIQNRKLLKNNFRGFDEKQILQLLLIVCFAFFIQLNRLD